MRLSSTMAIALLALASLTACGSGDDAAATTSSPSSATATPSEMGPEPWGPTNYMDKARGLWDLATEQGKAAFRDASTKEPSTTAGDPRAYENVCGATFTLPDGTLPAWADAPDGEKLAHVDADFPDGTYYDWLRSDPKRWSAFNAWLLDPAVIATVAVGTNADTLQPYPNDPSAAYLQKSGSVGDTSGCPDGAAKVRALPR